MERKKQRIEPLRIYSRKALPLYEADDSDNHCGKDVVSYRFTDLRSYRRTVVQHYRFAAMCLYAVMSLIQRVHNALYPQISNEL